MDYEILDSIWFTPAKNDIILESFMGSVDNLCIGIVAIKSTEQANIVQWKCYIGYGNGEDEASDTKRIAAHGMPLGNQMAAYGFFPGLPAEGYRY